MPFKSKAQQRFMYANKAKMEAEGVDVDEWSEKTDYDDLPERKDPDMKKSATELLRGALLKKSAIDHSDVMRRVGAKVAMALDAAIPSADPDSQIVDNIATSDGPLDQGLEKGAAQMQAQTLVPGAPPVERIVPGGAPVPATPAAPAAPGPAGAPQQGNPAAGAPTPGGTGSGAPPVDTSQVGQPFNFKGAAERILNARLLGDRVKHLL